MFTVQSLKLRWQALDRGARMALVGVSALVAGAIGVRIWFMVSYTTAFLGFADASQYALAAVLNIFRDAQRPAGYPFFLRLVHHFSDNLSFTIAVQHAAGVATGLLLYKAVRRTGAPPWLGLLPAAIVFFGGTGLFLEHSLLADPLFAFLQAVGVYAAIGALYDPRLRWPLLAGIAIGLSFWVKTVAISSAILIPIVLLCAAPGDTRRRLLSAVTVSLVAIGLIFTYVGAQYYFTGYLGYERQSAWNLYGRVATFVDCSKFAPPSGTRFLCPPEPLGHRSSEPYYQYAPTSPAVERFGPPYIAPLNANAPLKSFSVAAIEHEPVAYAKAIVGGLGRYFFPREGEGYTPQGMRDEVIEPAREQSVQPEIALFYPHSPSYSPTGDIHPLSVYESYTRVQGPLLILLLVAAIAGPFFLPARMRWAAIAFTLTAIFSITFAVAGNGYDARYAYPTFGPLAAGAALGAWGIGSFLSRMFRRRGQPVASPGAGHAARNRRSALHSRR
ncbi:MAG TPA: glycosyltransferase family 39 protein [Solirubrobacteraceae bacterium]|nr:glycosyltransferase family 39 protein [Solirubrobacteraceae bacterium]